MASTFGQYEILQKLGQGGMGAVYRARDTKLDRVVALKVMNPGTVTPQAYARFQREIKILAKLKHPNIVGLLAVGQVKNRAFFTMEYIEGKPLFFLIKEAPSYEERKELIPALAKVARAVHYAHEQDIIHRDLKPSNIIIDKNGEPHITDFGLARQLESDISVTLSGEAVGTAAYMSPEQAEGNKDKIGPPTDIWSLGAVLYETLAGRPPFQGPTQAAILEQAATRKPVSPRQVDRRVSRDLEAVCLACLAREPASRYAGADDLSKDLQSCLSGEGPYARKSLIHRKLGRLAAALVGIIVLVVIGTIILIVKPSQPDQPPPQAEGTSLTEEEMGRRLAEGEAQRETRSSLGSQESGAYEAAPERIAENRLPLQMTKGTVASYYSLKDITCIEASNEEVWLGTKMGVLQLDPASGEWTVFPVGSVTVIQRHTDGKWWIGTASRGLSCFDGKTWKTYTYKDGLADNDVRAIAIDGKGKTWCATRGGVSCLAGETWNTYSCATSQRGDHIQTAVIDPKGGKWFGTKHGVSYFDGKVWRVYTDADGLADNDVSAVAIDGEGNKWFGTRGGGVSCFDGKTWKTYTEKDGLADNIVAAIAIDAEGKEWFGTLGGVSCFDGESWKRYTTKDGLAHNHVSSIAIDADGTKWFGTSGGGVSCFDGETWKTYTENDGLASNYVQAIAIAAEGKKWFGTNWKGVSCFDMVRDRRRRFVLR